MEEALSVFEPFPKLARLARECVITEKLDGTNAQIIIAPASLAHEAGDIGSAVAVTGGFSLYAGSRTRLISPGKNTDNFGFAAWVRDNAAELVKLGEGRHFGEWWGQGIQRGYGLTEKRFSLFNAAGIASKPDCVSICPVLYTGVFETDAIKHEMGLLRATGSKAAPGFYDPEGIVVYHTHARVSFKLTYDDKHKDAA